MSSALSELQAGLRVMDEIDQCLQRHRESNDKAQSAEATKKLREVSVTLKSLAANPDAKSHDNMPLLIQLSKRMKDCVAQMKEIAGDSPATTTNGPPPSPVKASAPNEQPVRASVQLSASGDGEPTSLPAPVVPANAPAANGIPLEISGYLLKQGEKGLVKSYKKRWFTLRESRLYYYKSEDESVPINFVDMRDAVVSDPGEPNKQNDFGLKFQLVVDKRIYRLKCLSLDDAKRWLSILQNATETFNPALKKEKDKANARLSVRIVEKGTVDVAAAERDRIAAAERERVAAVERERVAAAERERVAAAERERLAAAEREQAAAADAAAVAAKAAPPPTPAKEAHDDAAVARGGARHKASTDAPPPVAPHVVDAPAVASAADDSSAAPAPEPHVEAPKKVVKQSVVGAWPVFEPVAPAAKPAAAAHAAPHGSSGGSGKHVDSKALEKLEAELAAKDRELTKEKLVAAAAAEQARVLTLERNDMKAEFGPLTQRLSKFEDEATQLRRALADQDAQLAAQAAEIKQLQASLTQARQAQADGQRLVTQLTARVRDVESPKKPSKAKAADDRERIVEMALAHQEQCQLLEQELSRTKASTTARVQQLEESLRAARAEAGDLLQRYQQARQCSITLSNSDYVAGLEAELANVRKELFYALAAATKLQCAMRGEVCNLPIDELFEKAQIEKLAVKGYPAFIAQATAAASPPPSSSSSPAQAQLANARSPQMARRAPQKN